MQLGVNLEVFVFVAEKDLWSGLITIHFKTENHAFIFF
jgi:hypothetical protein